MSTTAPARRTRRRAGSLPVVTVAAAMVVATAGCSGQSSGGGAGVAAAAEVPTIKAESAATDLLPEAIASSERLRIAIPTNEPPTQFYAEGTKEMTGVNPDIARLIGQVLDVDVEIVVANFDSIIPGIAAGRYDMTVSSMTPTAERMEVLDFVDYMQVGTAVAVPEGNPNDLEETSLCGRTVGFLTGSYQLTVNVPEYDDACAAAGEDPIEVDQFQDTRQAISALTSGRVDAVLADSPILDFAASQNRAVEVSSKFDFAPVAVGVPKEAGLIEAVAAALDVVVASDAYREVLENYGVETNAITDARVNVAQ